MKDSDKISIAVNLLFRDLLPSKALDSIREEPEMVTQVLFSIRENPLIAVDFFEEPLDKNLEVDRYWAYLLFHYDAMFAARKSNLDALSTHYNSAFSSLRTVLELIVRGAFYQCLCIPHQRKIILSMLNKDKKFKEFVSRLEDSEISEGPFQKLGGSV